MNLSIYQVGYLGSQVKDTPHSGKNALLRFGRASVLSQATDLLWLQQLGISVQDEAQLARWLLAAESPADLPAHGSLLLAQPVHLSLQRDSFALDELVQLSATEYQTLSRLFNQFFAETQLTFIPSVTRRYWFLHSPQPLQLQTHLLQTALQHNIQGCMPTGADAQQLRSIMNQLQMLMHEHPINQQRAQHGIPEVNSLWFSGVSHAQSVPPAAESKLLASALPLQADYKTIDDALQHQVGDACMLVEDDTAVPWDAIDTLLRAGKIKRLDGYWPAAQGTLKLSMTRLDCWKYWRKPRTLVALAQQSYAAKQAKL